VYIYVNWAYVRTVTFPMGKGKRVMIVLTSEQRAFWKTQPDNLSKLIRMLLDKEQAKREKFGMTVF